MPLLQQLSLFLENQPGHMKLPCRALGEAGIDILAMSLADTKQFGILRLVVKDPARAREVLEKAGCVVTTTDVLAVDVPDRPGGLAGVLASFEKAAIGIEYMYAFPAGERGKSAILVFRVEEPDAAATKLRAAGVRVLGRAEVFSLLHPGQPG